MLKLWYIPRPASRRRACESRRVAQVMYYVYILISDKTSKTYTGSTGNLQKRLKEHNLGKSKYTERCRPWKLFYQEELETMQDVRKREKYLKSCAGRKFIKKLFNNIPR